MKLICGPMATISHPAFRILVEQFGGCDEYYTEMINAGTLITNGPFEKYYIDPTPCPEKLVWQIIGKNEELTTLAVKQIAELPGIGIDINMGCPVKKVAGRGAGAGILKDIPKMIAITDAIVKKSKLPVTVKTRIGYEETNKPIVEVAERLQDVGVQALSIHGRTKTQMYKGDADWTLIGKVKENPRMIIPIFGNGDVTSAEVALEKKNRYGVDGILIGRGAIGNPWIFEQTKRVISGLPQREIPIAERVEVCKKHLFAAIEWKGERTAIMEMRKHYGGYFKGIPDFKQFRIPLVTYSTLDELLPIFTDIVNYYSD